MGYNIHGDEASGGNAALLMAYYLAALQGPRIDEILNQTVIILDPCYNPDGFQRYSTWVNMHKGTHVLQTHRAHREHNEVWPTGRTNHYWFDLNRDWLPVQHPESQARIRRFHQWKPNFLTDHHEMGTNSTFFFQPGIPSRNNPLTPPKVFDLTEKMGVSHAHYLDEIGSLYYSQESFDDFYYGKGSTYPDINGGVGILFEQATPEGHAQDSKNGLLTFPFAIRNQFRTSLSTLYGTHALRDEFLTYQRDFFQRGASTSGNDAVSGYAVKLPQDMYRFEKFIALLELHQIEVSSLPKSFSGKGTRFIQGKDAYISLSQPQHRLIRAMFDPVTEFRDSLFYDVSTWTIPMAFDLPYAPVPGSAKMDPSGLEAFSMTPNAHAVNPEETPYAFLVPPYAYQNPKFLNRCFKKGIRVKVAKREFISENRPYPRGTYVIPVQNQDITPAELVSWVHEQAADIKLPIQPAPSGLTKGANLGSNSFQVLEPPKVLLVVGPGVTSYEAGEVWHLLDTRYEMEVTMAEMRSLNKTT
ncbi:MAG: M14 family zinc carboxypeptidase, partial [Bacteroidota bacterium]